MKKDKKLQGYANESTERYNSPNILAELKQHIQPQEKWYEKMPKKTWYAVGGSLASAIVVVVVLLCVFLIKPNMVSPDVGNGDSNSSGTTTDIPRVYYYSGKNEAVALDSINKTTSIFDFEEINLQYCQRHIDDEYNETLFYRIEYYNEETLNFFRMNIVTNEDYQYPFQDTSLWVSTTYRGQQLYYFERIVEKEGLYTYEINAILSTESEKIDIYYSGIGLEETSNFLSVLDQIFVE